jgi:hypothetical protein
MVSAADIRSRVSQLLSGVVSLDEFDEWFSASTWNMHRDSDQEAQELAGAIELLLAEHSSGHLTDGDLRIKLSPFADLATAFIRDAHVEASTTIPAQAGYLRYALRSQKIEHYSSPGGSRGGSRPPLHRVSGTLRIDSGRRLNRPA